MTVLNLRYVASWGTETVYFNRVWEDDLSEFVQLVIKVMPQGDIVVAPVATVDDLTAAVKWLSETYLRPLKAIG